MRILLQKKVVATLAKAAYCVIKTFGKQSKYAGEKVPFHKAYEKKKKLVKKAEECMNK